MPPNDIAAARVVRLWAPIFNKATLTGDTARLKEMGSPECVSCRGMAQGIERVYAAGGYTKTKGWSITDLKILRDDSRSVVVRVDVHEPAGVTKASSETDPVPFPARTDTFEFELEAGSRWLITRIDLLA